MATMKKLMELCVADLKRECEERELETTGKKSVLQNRLKDYLQQNNEDPESFLFEVPYSVQQLAVNLQKEMAAQREEIIAQRKGFQQMEEVLQNKFMLLEETTQGLKQELRALDGEVKEEIKNLDRKVEEKIEALDSKLEEKVKDVNLRMNKEFCCHSKCDLNTDVKTVMTRVKPPTFDGKTSSWPNYLKQFEAAARTNCLTPKEKAVTLTVALRGEAMDVLQTLPEEEAENYESLVKKLEMRYGHAHLEQVYRTQIKNRRQKATESLQEFEVDVARLVRFAYSSAPEDVMECLAVQTFIDGARDDETQRALRLARPKTLTEALATALDFEAAKEASRGYVKVRTVSEDVNEQDKSLEQLVNKITGLLSKKRACLGAGIVGSMVTLEEIANGPQKHPLYNRINRKTKQGRSGGGTIDRATL